jgi:hypothetical protein
MTVKSKWCTPSMYRRTAPGGIREIRAGGGGNSDYLKVQIITAPLICPHNVRAQGQSHVCTLGILVFSLPKVSKVK